MGKFLDAALLVGVDLVAVGGHLVQDDVCGALLGIQFELVVDSELAPL